MERKKNEEENIDGMVYEFSLFSVKISCQNGKKINKVLIKLLFQQFFNKKLIKGLTCA